MRRTPIATFCCKRFPGLRANRRTNCHKTHRDFVWRLRFQFMPSEGKRETPLTCRQRSLSSVGEKSPLHSKCSVGNTSQPFSRHRGDNQFNGTFFLGLWPDPCLSLLRWLFRVTKWACQRKLAAFHIETPVLAAPCAWGISLRPCG
jgi:hypothetical protein